MQEASPRDPGVGEASGEVVDNRVNATWGCGTSEQLQIWDRKSFPQAFYTSVDPSCKP